MIAAVSTLTTVPTVPTVPRMTTPSASFPDGPTLPESALGSLPIFPLPNVVLLPGVVLPLHIFEPRYRALLDAAQREHRAIVMALLAQDHPPDDLGRPQVYEVVCAGLIVASETLADGRSNILLYGTQRLRIVEELHTDEPFRRVATEPLPDFRGPEDDAAADRLRRIALQISDSVPGAHQILGNILASARSPSHLGNLLAAQVLDPISLRQACLEEQHVATRLDTITDALGSALLHLMDDTETKGAH